MRLRNSEKILLHLYDYRKYEGKYEYPPEITQQGIAERIGISVTHVPRNIKKLVEDGLVKKIKAHVPGKKKKVTVYLLTPTGIAEVKKIIEKINQNRIQVGDEYYTLNELKKKLGIGYIDLLTKLDRGEITPAVLDMKPPVVFREVSVTIDDFVDRVAEIDTIESWFSRGGMLSIVGGRGSGKSYLVQRFLDTKKPSMHIIWLDVYDGRTWSSVKEVFNALFGSEDILSVLRTQPTLLIFDDYHDVDDEFVSALNALVKEPMEHSRVIVCMRKDTPYYNRFYTLSDLAEGRVTEINLDALPYEHARKLLPDVKESAFKRIYQISRGNPRILAALKHGTLDRENVALNGEEIHLLKFLASQKK
ncbi:MAG: AAA family ATPase [Euryarchaeota archaeon]|nr:AAA family ATPase [Euryarchaeota archaeon]